MARPEFPGQRLPRDYSFELHRAHPVEALDGVNDTAVPTPEVPWWAKLGRYPFWAAKVAPIDELRHE